MDYWKKHFNKNAEVYPMSFKKQVDMTQNQKEVDEEQVQIRIKSIIDHLKLSKEDVILDLCCGNGMLTKEISEKVKYVYAIDFSEGLINIAKKYNRKDNIKYISEDISLLNFQDFMVNKIVMYSCAQYFSYEGLSSLFSNLAKFEKVDCYVSNIPDKSKLWEYYDNAEKKEFYYNSLKEGNPHIGNWYYKYEIVELAKSNSFSIEVIDIDNKLNVSSYRFDALLHK